MKLIISEAEFKKVILDCLREKTGADDFDIQIMPADPSVSVLPEIQIEVEVKP